VVLSADSATPVSYDFGVADASDPPVTASGFDTVQSGTLDAGASAVFHYTAPAGLYVYFDGRNASSAVSSTLAGPGGATVRSGNTSSDTDLVLPQSGAYTLTLKNTSGTSQPYSFRLIDTQGPAVTPLTLGQDITGAPRPLRRRRVQLPGHRRPAALPQPVRLRFQLGVAVAHRAGRIDPCLLRLRH
jgi:hypothetical protein